MDTSKALRRYQAASAETERLRHRVASLAAMRAAALRDLHESGLSYAGIASLTGLTRGRVQQLVERGDREAE